MITENHLVIPYEHAALVPKLISIKEYLKEHNL